VPEYFPAVGQDCEASLALPAQAAEQAVDCTVGDGKRFAVCGLPQGSLMP
jgi:hypothetical protein